MLSISRLTIPVLFSVALAPLAGAAETEVITGEPSEVLEYVDHLKALPEVSYEVAQAGATDSPAPAGQEPVMQFDIKEKPQGQPDIFEQPVFNQLVSLDFKNADIQNVLRLVARRTGLNILLDPSEVSGNITLSLENVRLGHALDSILKVNKLAYIIEAGDKDSGVIVRIVPESRVGRDAVETKTEVIELNWRNALDMQKTFEPFLTSHGSMKANEEAQAIIITDVPPNIERIKLLISQIDRPDRQVDLQYRLVDLNIDAGRDFSTEWSMAKINKANLGHPLLAGGGTSGGTGTGTTGSDTVASAITDVAALGALGTVGGALPVLVEGAGVTGGQGTLQFGSVVGIFGDDYNLNATLTAFEQRGYVQILANPRVTTLNNVKANIEIVEQIPYIEATQGPTEGSIVGEVEFEKAGVLIGTKPIITPNGHIRLDIDLEQRIFRRRVGASASSDARFEAFNPPQIDIRNAQTTVIVKDKNTVVLGGLRNQRSAEAIDGVPWMHRIPLIGWAFKDTANSRTKTDLLLMCTPKIVEQALITDEEKEKYDRIDAEWHLPDYMFDDVSGPEDKIPAGRKNWHDEQHK